jgi:hypothetical protein
MEDQTVKINRPTFLTVLCILSFVGLGWDLLNSLVSIIWGTILSPFLSFIQTQMETGLNEASTADPAAAFFIQNFVEAAMKLIENLPLIGALFLICDGIALAGVILMWKLKRLGFYLYSGAKVVLIFVPLMVIGSNLLSTIMSICIFIGAALFITLYAVNFKHLT